MFINTGKRLINLNHVVQVHIQDGANFWNLVLVFAEDEYSIGFPSKPARDKTLEKLAKHLAAFDLRK